MRNVSKLLGIVVLITTIVLSMSACGGDDDTSTDNGGNVSLIGTKWIDTWLDGGYESTNTIHFISATTCTITVTATNPGVTPPDPQTLTYSVSGNTITFTGEGGSFTGTVSGNNLYVSFQGETIVYTKVL